MKNTPPNKKLNIKKIAQQLDKLGLSASKLASELDVSREAVSQWLKGRKFPRPAILLKMSQLLKLSFEEIITRIETEEEPVIAFRRKGGRKTKPEYIENAKEMGCLLEELVPYLPYDKYSRPPTLIEPMLDYDYIHEITEDIRSEVGLSSKEEISFKDLINFFNDFHAVLIPVFWGNKEHHENALHIFLPKTMTTWIYLNLDSKIHDFKFWMAHELGHIKSPNLKFNEAEDFADDFAGALLITKDIAERTYYDLRNLIRKNEQINYIKNVAEDLVVSPLTVYYEVNKFADHAREKKINLESEQEIFKVFTKFNKSFPLVSEFIFNHKTPTPSEYMKFSDECFKSPFFPCVKEFIKQNKKSAGFLQNILDLTILDAHNLYDNLI